MSTKPAKIASNKKAPAQKIVKQCKIIQEGDSFIAIDYARGKKVTAAATADICRRHAAFRHGYEVIA